MTRTIISRFIAATGLLLLPIGASAQTTLTIAAAANLTKVFNSQLLPLFKAETGITVLPSYGATGVLATQLENGAPYQVFVSADAKTPWKLAAEGDLDPHSVATYAVGELALWSKSLPVESAGLGVFSSATVATIAVADPKTAPYGAATIETLKSASLLNGLNSKIVYAGNIGQALQYAQSGNADVAFTALSLALGAGGSTFIVPGALHTPIVQDVAVIPSAPPAAIKFEQFLLGPDARKILLASGYLSP
jgi:molybdate transport system substrate-binding protein